MRVYVLIPLRLGAEARDLVALHGAGLELEELETPEALHRQLVLLAVVLVLNTQITLLSTPKSTDQNNFVIEINYLSRKPGDENET